MTDLKELIEPNARVAAARRELAEAIADLGEFAGAIPIVRLVNAIEDMIDARIAALLRALQEQK